MQSASLHIEFERELVAGASEESAFLLPQRKIRCAFFWVGGSGRRSLEHLFGQASLEETGHLRLETGRSGDRGALCRGGPEAPGTHT